MREDMSRVVTERPRRGGDGGKSIPAKGYKKRQKKTPLDEQPRREKITAPYGWDTKEFSDLIGPLRGYLNKQVGRPWDKIWSEVCANLRITSVSQSHIRDHVEMEVEKNVVMVGKVPYPSSNRRWARDGYPLSGDQLYVNPNTGLLCKTKPSRRYVRPKQKLSFFAIGGKWYHAKNGIWYRLEMKMLPPEKEPQYDYSKRTVPITAGYSSKCTLLTRRRIDHDLVWFDAFLKCTLSRRDLKTQWGFEWRCSSMKQLNKREIKKLGLRDL